MGLRNTVASFDDLTVRRLADIEGAKWHDVNGDGVLNTQSSALQIVLGDVDGLTYNGQGSVDDVPVDPQWLDDVVAQTPTNHLVQDFDLVEFNRNVLFTFKFELLANQRVTAATLTMAMRGSICRRPNMKLPKAFLRIVETVTGILVPNPAHVRRQCEPPRAVNRVLAALIALFGMLVLGHCFNPVSLTAWILMPIPLSFVALLRAGMSFSFWHKCPFRQCDDLHGSQSAPSVDETLVEDTAPLVEDVSTKISVLEIHERYQSTVGADRVFETTNPGDQSATEKLRQSTCNDRSTES